MSEQAEQRAGSIPPDSGVRVEREEALQSLEYAIRALTENANFAREMADRARSDNDPDSASDYEREAAEALRHATNLSTLAGSFRLINQINRPRRSRAA